MKNLSMLTALLLAGLAPSELAASAMDPGKPDVIEFEAPLDGIVERLAPLCSEMEIREFDPPEFPLAEDSHRQIDCRGFQFLGKPRLAEFVFADDRLKMVWILVDPEESEQVISAMRSRYGSDGVESNIVIAFPEYRTAWRHEPAEVLFYSGSMSAFLESRFSPSEN